MYDRCHIADGCGGDEACAALCPNLPGRRPTQAQTFEEKAHALLGRRVTVTNPRHPATWSGRAIAASDRPTILIEDEQGHRYMLPLEWAAIDKEGR